MKIKYLGLVLVLLFTTGCGGATEPVIIPITIRIVAEIESNTNWVGALCDGLVVPGGRICDGIETEIAGNGNATFTVSNKSPQCIIVLVRRDSFGHLRTRMVLYENDVFSARRSSAWEPRITRYQVISACVR